MYDKLVEIVSEKMQEVPDHRGSRASFSLHDCLMGAFAMFALKDPSILSFVSNYPARKTNLEQIYKIQDIPSDNGMRKILDPVLPEQLLPTFKALFDQLRSQGLLEKRTWLDDYLLLSIDGTGVFSSDKVSCPQCLTKKLKNGETIFHHQMLGACVVTPGQKTVFPVYAEAIVRQDGNKKNDCERNACKRMLPNIRKVLPNEKILVLLDALYADGPTIKALQNEEHNMDYMIVIKEGFVLIQAERLELKQWQYQKDEDTICTFKWAEQLILNGAHQDILVNYLEYEELNTKKDEIVYKNKWITNLPIKQNQLIELAEAGRARWKIENETFNTLKNQDYKLEHNFGHGKYYLSTVLALLMFLAFFVDQITRAFDQSFELALKEAKTLRDLRQKVRALFDLIPTISMNLIYQIIARQVRIFPQLE